MLGATAGDRAPSNLMGPFAWISANEGAEPDFAIVRQRIKSVGPFRQSSNGNQLNDYYGGQAIVMPKSDGRYLFELRDPGPYKVRFMGTGEIQDTVVNAGIRSNVDGCL